MTPADQKAREAAAISADVQLAADEIHRWAFGDDSVIKGRHDVRLRMERVMDAFARPPLPALSDDEREAIAMIVKRTNAKWAGPSMAEFANDPPTRTHYSIADQVLAYLAARRSPVPADTPSEVEHGADWSDWGIDHPEEGPSCKCGFNGSPEECAASRPTPPEDAAALIDEAERYAAAHESQPGGAWSGTAAILRRLIAALAARTDTASESPPGLELPVETPSAMGVSEDVTDDALLATLEEHYLVPQEDLDRDYERASLIRGLRAVAALAEGSDRG